MKTDEQRIAIAQACPQLFWIYRSPTESSRTLRPPTPRLYRIGEHPNNGDEQCDPLNDLNAMNEAEKVLEGSWSIPPTGEVQTYHIALIAIATREDVMIIHTTAAQRAEAFLKTLGLWTD